ncbi:MAG: glycosyltransferase family 4 protein [Nitrososphaerota archaeon]|nr:glycosyltransferase family 4 protein [Nitrososphaerota archaeon]
MLRVGINGLFLGSIDTGIGQYTLSLIKGLNAHGDGLHPVIFVDSSGERLLSDLRIDTRLEHVTISHRHWKHEILNAVSFERAMESAARTYAVQLVHSPYPLFHSIKSGIKYVATVHDTIPSLFKKYRGGTIRNAFLCKSERNLQHANSIITVSHYSKRDLIKYLCLEESKIHVIYEWVDELFNPQPVLDVDLRSFRRRHKIPDQFLLYIGGFDYRKNVGTLLKAFALLKHNHNIANKLVLAGRYSPTRKQLKNGLVEDIVNSVRQLGIERDVVCTGYIPQIELPLLYKSAILSVYPSLYEGFGLPLLEAMSCGTPVLASSTSSIPEVLPNQNLLFDPNDVVSLSEKIRLFLERDELRRYFSKWGIERASFFNRDKIITRTKEAYLSA